MAYKLVERVLHHAPAGLTPAERLVLVVIAEQTHAGSTSCQLSSVDLAARAGLDASAGRGLRHALQRLAGRGLDVRVAVANDRHGRPLYAVPGRVPTYRLPDLPAPAGCRCTSCAPEEPQVSEGGPAGPPTDTKADPPVHLPEGPQVTEGGPTGPPQDKVDPQVRQADPGVHQGGPTGPAAGPTGPPTRTGITGPAPRADARDPDDPVAELRLAIEDAGLPAVRWDSLTADDTAEIGRLVAEHGIRPLVAAAKLAHRPDDPARSARAWLALWRDRLSTGRTPPPRRRGYAPPHCGVCDPVTRFREDPDTGVPRRCPDCHPLATARRTA